MKMSKVELAGVAMLATAAPFIALSVYQTADALIDGNSANWEWPSGFNGNFEKQSAYDELDAAYTNFMAGGAMAVAGCVIFAVTSIGREVRQQDEQANTNITPGEPK